MGFLYNTLFWRRKTPFVKIKTPFQKNNFPFYNSDLILPKKNVLIPFSNLSRKSSKKFSWSGFLRVTELERIFLTFKYVDLVFQV